jgi:type I restriction enzyme M protein
VPSQTRSHAAERSAGRIIPCGIRTGSPRPTTTPTNSTAFPWGLASPANPPRTGAGFSTCTPAGRAAVVLDTSAASRGSGNAGTNKEKTVRQWFVDRDLIESVLYLPENLFYNTPASGIVLFLNKTKPKERKGKVFLVNASQIFEKGDPKNFIPEEGIQRIADTLIEWKEEEKLSRIVDHAELKKNDYNISPSRYIHTSDAETYRPVAEIVAELDVLEADAAATDKALRTILKQLGV